MNTVLFYDTETTGIPDWKTPSDDPAQPHLVQLAAVLCDADTCEIIQSIDLIIKPDGWIIPEEVTAIHGISTEKAFEVGVSEKFAVEALLQIRAGADRVAYNKTFDQQIIRIAMMRYFDEATTEAWAAKEDHHCAMRMAQKAIGGKQVKLEVAYEHFTGNVLEKAHTAMADTLACMKVYFAALDAEAKRVLNPPACEADPH